MKLVVKIKLLPTPVQAESLLRTMKAFNLASDFAAEVSFEKKAFRQKEIHAECYYDLRESFGLPAQSAVRVIRRLAGVYERSHAVCPKFRSDAAIGYDSKSMTFKTQQRVSLLTVDGREWIDFIVGDCFGRLMDRLGDYADLIYRDGHFFLHVVADVDAPPTIQVTECLGVDLGIVNIATDSDGDTYSGAEVLNHRRRYAVTRRTFQRRGTRSAIRHLHWLKGRESRYQKWVNHNLSKTIVAKALQTGRGIALENLTHLRDRVEKTVRKEQRRNVSSWSFSHLRKCITYKAELVGIPVAVVNPRNTSRTCSACGHCEKDNRKNQSEFLCVSCGYQMNADHNAAINISRLGRSANPPHERRVPTA